VVKGIPFRKAHDVVGSMVRDLSAKEETFRDLTLSDFKKYSDLIEEDVFAVLDEKQSVTRKRSLGSTSPEEVEKQIKKADTLLKDWEAYNSYLEKVWNESFERLVGLKE
jgi:argininosuccinate lyase